MGFPAAFSSRIAHLDEIVRTIFRHFNPSGVQNGNAGDKTCEQVRTLLRGQGYQQPAGAGAGDRELSRVREAKADSLFSACAQVVLGVCIVLKPPPVVPCKAPFAAAACSTVNQAVAVGPTPEDTWN